MKVLIVFNQPAPYKVKLFNLLAKKIDLTVIFERTSCPNRDKLFYASNEYNFKHYFLKKGSFGEENSNTNELIKHFKNNTYDLIIMNGYSKLTEIRAIKYLNRHHIPWTLFINGGLVKKELWIKKIYKKSLIKTAKNYLSPSVWSNDYLAYYGAKRENIFLYPNSTIYEKDILTKPLTNKEKEDLREKYRLPKNKRIIICPSQFITRKNNLMLLKCFKNREEILILAGNGPLKEKYQNYIKNNFMHNVFIYDYIKSETLNDFYRLSDAFITLSKEDIYGHTVNEAMAQGLPVISSNNVIAGKTLIRDGENGFIVNPYNENEIRSALDKINTLSSLKSIETAQKYTLEVQADTLAHIILEKLK